MKDIYKNMISDAAKVVARSAAKKAYLYIDDKMAAPQDALASNVVDTESLECLVERYKSTALSFDVAMEEARKQAELAEKYAAYAKCKEVSWFNGKADAISAVQQAIPQLAQAQISSLKVQSITFDYIQQLTEIVQRIQEMVLQNKRRISEVIVVLKEFTESNTYLSFSKVAQNPMKDLFANIRYQGFLQGQIDALKAILSDYIQSLKDE